MEAPFAGVSLGSWDGLSRRKFDLGSPSDTEEEHEEGEKGKENVHGKQGDKDAADQDSNGLQLTVSLSDLMEAKLISSMSHNE